MKAKTAKSDVEEPKNENHVPEDGVKESLETNLGDEVVNTDIKLRFVNQSNDMNNSEIVVFSKNVSQDFGEMAVAWRVIKNCGRGWSHSFNFPVNSYVAATDSYGNTSDLKEGFPGQKWDIVRSSSGDVLQLDTEPALSPLEIEIKNNLPMGSIDAQIYKDGKLFATKTGVSPGQKAVFSFHPTIWIGVVSQVEEGEVINSAIISDINTELSLLGIHSADIIMTGGGVGPMATPFEFHLVPTT